MDPSLVVIITAVCLLQRRLGIWAYSLIVLTSVLFTYPGLQDCSRAAFQYYGLPTTEVRRSNLGWQPMRMATYINCKLMQA
jgi:hypothetical protein